LPVGTDLQGDTGVVLVAVFDQYVRVYPLALTVVGCADCPLLVPGFVPLVKVLPVLLALPVELAAPKQFMTVLNFSQLIVHTKVDGAALSTVASPNWRLPSVNVVVAVPEVGPFAVT
jgi:hypothetical protein